MFSKMISGLKSMIAAKNPRKSCNRRQGSTTYATASSRTTQPPTAPAFTPEEKRAGATRGPDPVHFRTDRAPDVPAFVRPSRREVQRLQAFRKEHQHFVEGDYRKGLLYGGRKTDWVWAMSLPGGTHQHEIRVDLTPGMTVHDLAEQARVAWGWAADDDLRVYFLGSELHHLWKLADCGVEDLCQLRISRRPALRSHPISL